MTPFEILGINKYSTKDEVKNAYRSLLWKYHPDTGNGDIEKFNEVRNAYIRVKENKDFNSHLTLSLNIPINEKTLAECLGETKVFEYNDVFFDVMIPYQTRVGDTITVKNILPETTLKVRFIKTNEQ